MAGATSPGLAVGDPAGSVAVVPAGPRAALRPVQALLLCVALAAPLGAGAKAVNADAGHDLLGVLAVAAARTAAMSAPFALVVAALAALHYVATAVAARAASSVPLRFGETFRVQLAASAANRITPGGLGAAAVNARYFARRGLDARAAVGAVAVLALLGGLADILVFTLIAVSGRALGIGGSTAALHAMWSALARLARVGASPWAWSAVPAAAVVTVLAVRLVRRRRPAGRTWRRYARPARELARRPRALATLLAASGSTTLIMAVAFTMTVRMVPGVQPHVSVASLVLGYMAAAAVGNAVPVPAGVGSTEVALAGLLTAVGLPLAQAVQVVLAFRVITFWAPAVVGVAVTPRLRRARAL